MKTLQRALRPHTSPFWEPTLGCRPRLSGPADRRRNIDSVEPTITEEPPNNGSACPARVPAPTTGAGGCQRCLEMAAVFVGAAGGFLRPGFTVVTLARPRLDVVVDGRMSAYRCITHLDRLWLGWRTRTSPAQGSQTQRIRTSLVQGSQAQRTRTSPA